MSRETVSQPATPATSTGTSKTGLMDQAPKGAQAQDRIARRAYELYEQRGREDGWALEDWLNAERQLVGASSK